MPASKPISDKEMAREAFAAGREWVYAQNDPDKYDVSPPNFEDWWQKMTGGKE